MNPDTFACPACGVRFKRGDLPAGKKIRCPKCSEVFEIPPVEDPAAEFEELEELVGDSPPSGGGAGPAAPVSRAGSARTAPAGGRRSSARKAGAGGRASSSKRSRGGRGRREEASTKKSKAPLLLGIALLAAAGITIFVLTSGSGKDSGKKGSPEKAGARAEEETPKTPREEFEGLLAKVSGEASTAGKVRLLRSAIEVLERSAWKGAPSPSEIHRRILEVDPEDEAAHLALGHTKFTEDFEKYRGKWLTKEEYRKALEEFREHKKALEKKKAAEIEKARWTKDAFCKKAKQVRDYFVKDVSKVPNLDLKFYFDIPEVPRPYFLMVEDAKVPDPEATAKTLGPGLAALRRAFAKGYPKGVFADWDDEEFVVPVMIFKDSGSYENYRKNGHTDFPTTGLAAAFYTSKSEVPTAYKGVLYVWQGAKEAQFYHEVFHEATHQLMHNACESENMGPTPWLQEGIAEFWGSHKGNRYSGYTFGRFLHGRYPTIQMAANAYMKALKAGKKQGAFLTPKDLLSIDQEKFLTMKAILDGRIPGTPAQKASAGMTVSLIYAEGWAFIYFCYNYEGGKYKNAFEKMVADDLRYGYSFEKAAEHLGMKTDEDWDLLAKRFFVFCLRAMRRDARRGG